MKDLISQAELKEYFNNEEFVLKTQQQISKDFAKFNMIFPEKFENTLFTKEAIEGLIADHLIEFLKEGESRLLQLMYTIDLPESQFLHLTTQTNFIQLLSEKIVMREAYKVFLRKKFSA